MQTSRSKSVKILKKRDIRARSEGPNDEDKTDKEAKDCGYDKLVGQALRLGQVKHLS